MSNSKLFLFPALLCIASIIMNIAAAKCIYMNGWIAIDAGVSVSWIAFLVMDIVIHFYGEREADRLAVKNAFLTVIASGIFCLIATTPGKWCIPGGDLAGPAIDNVIGGTFIVILVSIAAMFFGSILNNRIHILIRKIICFSFAAVISTFIAQFAENLFFSILICHLRFDWSILQCVGSSVFGAALETIVSIPALIIFIIGRKIKNRKLDHGQFRFEK